MKKLICIDLDGTLLSWNKKISKYNRETILEVLEQGHIVMLATGRAFENCIKYANELKLDVYGGYIASYNGSTIYNCKTKEILKEFSIDSSTLSRLFKFLESKKYEFTALQKDVQYVSDRRRLPFEIYRKFNGKESRHYEKLIDDKLPIQKILINDTKSKLEDIRADVIEEFGNEVSTSISSIVSVEITPKEANKGNAMSFVAQELGISIDDTIAIGNQGNDETMIRLAGFGVSVGNGTSKIKELADVITDSNNKNGVGKFLEENLL